MMNLNREGRMAEEKKKLRTADRVAADLAEAIAEGRWALGEKIPVEAELMKLFSAGRSSIREAIRTLSRAGLVEARQGAGTYVISRGTEEESLSVRLRRASLLDVYEVRRMLEAETAKSAANRRDADDVSAMKEALARRKEAEKTGDKKAYVEADVAFHTAVAEATKNPVLAELYEKFSAAISMALTDFVHDEKLYRNHFDMHEALCEAIEAGDAIAAQYWATLNLDRTVADIRLLERKRRKNHEG
jgi:GntR family transcriptional regulator, transcriptional repressor for pyruvate dehydrogenase complex